jgi:hypothetical protein
VKPELSTAELFDSAEKIPPVIEMAPLFGEKDIYQG